MKKFICLFLVCAMLLSLCACGQNDYSQPNNWNNGNDYDVNDDTLVDNTDSNIEDDDEEDVEKVSISCKVGDTITFGSYEQDNDISNDKEDIEWIVLDINGKKALVVSKYILDSNSYNNEIADVTWETCTLRSWLNEEFLSAAFSREEQATIVNSTISVDRVCESGVDYLGTTRDKVFLLSMDEVTKYFDSDTSRQCEITDYAVANGVYVYPNGFCFWWLRTSEEPRYYSQIDTTFYPACVVYPAGKLGNDEYSFGEVVQRVDCGVRPAMWIEIE